MRQMTKEFSNSSVYFLQAQVELPFLQWGGFPLLQGGPDQTGFCKMAGAWSTHDGGCLQTIHPSSIILFLEVYCCVWKFSDSPDIFVSSKKYLLYTNLQDTLTIDHISAWHHIHLLWKPITQLPLRYLKGHNVTLHTGFESKANRCTCCICTDAFNAESNNVYGSLKDDCDMQITWSLPKRQYGYGKIKTQMCKEGNFRRS